MSLSEFGRYFKRPTTGAFCLRKIVFARAKPLKERGMRDSQTSKGRTVLGIDCDRAFEHFAALLKFRLSHARQELESTQVILVGLGPGVRPTQCLFFALTEDAPAQ